MDWKVLSLVFGTVFVAELGDKTQLATLLFATDKAANKWLIFVGASLVLIATSAIGVVAGSVVANFISERGLRLSAGALFIIIGVWTLLR